VARKNLDKFKSRVREITGRNRGVSFTQRCVELRRYFQGWVGYFRLVPIKSFFSDLDKWARRRIRMCIWKQWKTGRTRVAALMKLGIAEHEAFTHGMSSKGPWVLSSSQAVHQALSTALLEERGLPSLLGIWTKLTAKSRIA
jgi:RNA-directed DNA polymerase